MLLKQVSIFVENKEGKIADVLSILGENNVDIMALSIADTTNFGILRLIVDDPKKAKQVLAFGDMIVKINDILAVAIPDDPGSLSKVIKLLSGEKLGIEYMYAFTSNNTDNAMIVLKMSDTAKAYDILKSNNITVIESEDIKQKWD